MSFLGSLFDPVGAVATGGNNNTFDSVFSPGDNLFGSNGLDLEPSFMDSFNSNVTQPIGSFADNVVDTGLDENNNLWNHFKQNPGQVFYSGADPASTKLWNGITNQNNTSFLNQYGGETNKDYQNSQDRGVNTQDGQIVGGIANMVAGAYGGSALGDVAGYGAQGLGASPGATEGGMGSSALDVQSELANPSLAGSGGSQAGFDASQIPGWSAPVGGVSTSGANAFGGATRGAAAGGANSLDNGSNPWTGAFKGGVGGGINSGMDYAGSLGIDNPYLKSAFNGGVTGGVRTGMGDESQTGYGALVGALGGLASSGANSLGNYLSQPSGTSSGGGTGTSTGTTNWGNLATGLGNLYMSSRNNAGIQGQINNLNSMYQPGGAYATQMQQALDRLDAAGGRRSQYGTRAVELQAALARGNSMNAPTLANLFAQQRQNRFGQLSGLLAMGKNSGAFNSLGGMFGQSGQPAQGVGSITPGSQMPQIDPTTMNQDYQNTIPGQINPNQIYGG